FAQGERQHSTSPHAGRSGEEGRSLRWACFVTAGLLVVNPQECRTRRDPFSIDRSSTKPCGKYRSAIRTCLRSVLALTDRCARTLPEGHVVFQKVPPPHCTAFYRNPTEDDDDSRMMSSFLPLCYTRMSHSPR
ncbi:hypothetical protein ATANTOWER_024938, partial [Ataeniobius toweri]|nr:hypothetical protein [Ataeniobius toweri]